MVKVASAGVVTEEAVVTVEAEEATAARAGAAVEGLLAVRG